MQISLSSRLHATPFERRVIDAGAKAFTVYNHTILPTVFTSLEHDYTHLVEHVQLWDVTVQRQVDLRGPDALKLMELMTPRDISRCAVGRCMYAPLIDERALMINDPVVLRLAEDHFWISIADADVLLWAKGLALGMNLDVDIHEPDVSPLAIQGPKSFDLAADLLGEWTRELKFFHHREFELDGIPLVVARSGWSKQGGYELYLRDGTLGEALWDEVIRVGEAYNLRAGCPNLIERIESGLLSYGNDITEAHNPLECGLDQFCQIDKTAPYLGREALMDIRDRGVDRHITGVRLAGEPMSPNRSWLWVYTAKDDEYVGAVSSAVYSPRLKSNIGIAMLSVQAINGAAELYAKFADGSERAIETTALPFT